MTARLLHSRHVRFRWLALLASTATLPAIESVAVADDAAAQIAKPDPTKSKEKDKDTSKEPAPTKDAPAAKEPAGAPPVAKDAASNPLAVFEHKPAKAPDDRVSLQIEDTELDGLVKVISEMTGKRFVLASPKLGKVKVSIVAPEKVTVAVAYQAFLSVLSHNGLTVLPRAGFYNIVESQDIARQLTPLERGELPSEERYVTRIHRLAHLSAEEVVTNVLSKLQTKDASIIPFGNVLIITETAANLRRMLDILSLVDQAGEEDRLWLRPVKYLPAGQVEKQISEMLGLKGASLSGTSGATGGKSAEPSANAMASSGGGGASLHIARIVALERPNAVVVVGTRASYDRVAELLDVIDVAPSNELKVQVILLQHADAKKIVNPINEALGNAVTTANAAGQQGGARASAPATALEAQVKVAADETTNALIVTATPRDFLAVREVIRALDRPKRQVYIEAAVLDISAESGLDLGVAWHGGHVHDALIGPDGAQQTTYGGWRPGTSGGVPSATDLQAFALGIRGPEIPFLKDVPGLTKIPSFGAFLSAVATAKGADILSTPTIMASDNTQAEIKVQLQTSLQPNAPSVSFLPGASGTSSIPGFPGATPTSSNVAGNYKGIGPHIKITPHLNDSDEVRLDVIEVISDVQSAPGPSDTFGTISYLERTATTTLTVKDGRTVVIGGLTRNRTSRTESKVPILGDIPLLGALFRQRSDRQEKSNLVLVLTPYIVRDEVDMMRIHQRKMDERQELIDHDALFKTTDWKAPHDWQRTRGLLAEIRNKNREVAIKKKEADDALAQGDAKPSAPIPFDLPIPQVGVAASGGNSSTSAKPSPSAAAPAPAPTPPLAGAAIARPNIIER